MAAVTKLTDLVKADEVRALLGVSLKELPDIKIDLPVYLRSIKIAVGRLDPQHRFWGAFESLPGEGLSGDQQRFSDAFLAFVGWKAASLLAVSLPQFAPRSVTDGKAAFQRQPDAPMDVITNIESQLAQAAGDLTEAGAVFLPAEPVVVTATSIFQRATFGATDPITG